MSDGKHMNSGCDPVISNLRVAGSIPAAPTRLSLFSRNSLETMEVAGEFPSSNLPVAHKPDYYLRAQIRFLLLNIDQIKRYQGHLRGAVQDRLRDLTRELRNTKGFASWWAIIFGGLCLALLALVAVTHMPKVVIYQAPSSLSPIGDTFQILQKGTDPNHWQMRRLHYEHNALVSSLDFWTTTCDSVPLSPGETLTWLSYEDRGKCWSVSDKALGYTFLRDDKGNVILAPNCYWITDVLATCNGVPKF